MIIGDNAVVLGVSQHKETGKYMAVIGLQHIVLVHLAEGGVLDFPLGELQLERDIDRIVIMCAKDGDELAQMIADTSGPDTEIKMMTEEGGVEDVPPDPSGLS